MNSIVRNQLRRNLRNLVNTRTFIASKTVGRSYLPVLNSLDGVKSKRAELMAHYPDILNDMKNIGKSFDPMEGEGHFERLMNYNIAGGKKYRALMVMLTFEELAPKPSQTEENLKLTIYLGWCLEMIHGSCLMLDDVVDGSLMRRGKLCWYKQDNLPLTGVNDGLMLAASPAQFLMKHFSHMPCYVNLLEVLSETLTSLSVGNFMDFQTKYQDVLTFSVEQYRQIVAVKTAHCTFYTPIALANQLIESNQIIPANSRKILNEMGCFFQIQDDFLDCYGDPAVTGKDGTDIQDGKCTWLVVTFLSLANEVQKAKLKENYGMKDEKAIQCVKELYDEVGLKKVFRNYEEKAYQYIKSDIKQARGLPMKLCLKIMDRLNRREF